MSEYLIQEKSLTDIADAIREKAGSADSMNPAEMVEAILGIQAGGGDSEGITVKYGTVTPTEDISGQLPLFEVDDENVENIPRALLVMYYPMQSKNSAPEKLLYCGLIFRRGNPGSDQQAQSTNFFINFGMYYFPSYDNVNVISTTRAIKNGMLQYPYQSMASLVFPAGERFYYLAVYSEERMHVD